MIVLPQLHAMKIHFTTFLFLIASYGGMGQSANYESFVSNEQVIDRENSSWAMEQPYVILISIDGFRYDYAQKYNAQNILKLGENGATAKKMLPSFPSKTFPNHYTIVSGLFPGHHGIVSNHFYSRERDQWYKVGHGDAVGDGSWYGGVPLWSLAEQHQMLSASLFWVGSEAEIAGVRPSYSYAYDGSVPNDFRTRRVVEWLKLPCEKRPHAIFTYFSLVDDAGHRFGPDHEQTGEAVAEIDELIGNLMAQLKTIDLPVHLVLVSDHGMTDISRGIVLPDAVDLKDAMVSYSIPAMIYQSDAEKRDQLYRELLEIPNLDVYTSDNLPQYLMFHNTDRIGDLILIPEAPAITMSSPSRVYGGTHGFNPYVNEDMGAVFFAFGPKIMPGIVMPPFENIHIYPFIAEILNLQITEPIDGNTDVLKVVLR